MSIRLRKRFLFLVILPAFIFALFWSFVPAIGAALPGGYDTHFLKVSLDINHGRISGTDTITFADATLDSSLFLPGLLIDRNIRIKRVELFSDHTPLLYTVRDPGPGDMKDGLFELFIRAPSHASLSGVPITIHFEGSISPIEIARMRIERGVSFSGIAVMGTEGAFLPSSAFWFPRRAGPPALYEVEVSLPKGYQAVMEGELVEDKVVGARSVVRYKTSNPTEGVNLVAGRYVVTSERYKGVDIYTYFYQDDEVLSRTYIDKTKGYIDAFEPIFPAYPYKKFAVVENFLPTGFGMPSFTLLGSKVLRLPFIPDTALGHEFVHNWWGNGVFIDVTFGNWSEALTTYTSDHLFKVKAGSASAYRMKALVNYANYAGESERSVSSYRFGSSPEARAIGYSKAMMIFHMLRNLVGDEVFFKSLRNFYDKNAFSSASWDEIRLAFEEVAKRDLSWFFDQWLLRSGGPRLSIGEPRVSTILTSVTTSAPAYRLSLVIRQDKPLYRLKVPISVVTEGGEVTSDILFDREMKEVTLEFSERPLSVEVDPDVEIFRILSGREIPPSLATLLGDERAVLVLPKKKRYRKRYLPVARKLQGDYGLKIVDDTRLKKEGLKDRPHFIFGSFDENVLFDSFKGALPEGLVVEDDFFVVNGHSFSISDSVLVAAFRGTSGVDNNGRGAPVVCIFFGGLNAKEMEVVAKRLPHLTGKGYLVFSRGGGLKYGSFEGEKSLKYEFGW